MRIGPPSTIVNDRYKKKYIRDRETAILKSNKLKIYDEKYINDTCKKFGIENYIINNNLTIDVNGDVNLGSCSLSKLPIKFNKVSGHFYCFNNMVLSLDGCPKIVEGDFHCYMNNLTNLIGGPESVSGDYECYKNQITDLIGCPKFVGGEFNASTNKIKTLKSFNTIINNQLNLNNNLITDMCGYPVCNGLQISQNPIYKLLSVIIQNLNKESYTNDLSIVKELLERIDEFGVIKNESEIDSISLNSLFDFYNSPFDADLFEDILMNTNVYGYTLF